jgi:hypothetical protein
MASSRALWVFGVARLISSARISCEKTGPGRKRNSLRSRSKIETAGDVGRQQVAGELDAGELQAEQAGQSMGQGGLAQARQIFDQQVAAGKQAGGGEADFVRLAEDDFVGASEHGVEGAGAKAGMKCRTCEDSGNGYSTGF